MAYSDYQPRPMKISREEYEKNWDRIFGKKPKPDVVVKDTVATSDNVVIQVESVVEDKDKNKK